MRKKNDSAALAHVADGIIITLILSALAAILLGCAPKEEITYDCRLELRAFLEADFPVSASVCGVGVAWKATVVDTAGLTPFYYQSPIQQTAWDAYQMAWRKCAKQYGIRD